jgi:hypothetical protein
MRPLLAFHPSIVFAPIPRPHGCCAWAWCTRPALLYPSVHPCPWNPPRSTSHPVTVRSYARSTPSSVCAGYTPDRTLLTCTDTPTPTFRLRACSSLWCAAELVRPCRVITTLPVRCAHRACFTSAFVCPLCPILGSLPLRSTRLTRTRMPAPAHVPSGHFTCFPLLSRALAGLQASRCPFVSQIGRESNTLRP